ncbi:MAG: PilZ domain-containing protein [Bdellovibrionales bacterium]|nr:PilZ domain-containing protein [Bdellovibrionales bacterium]
MANQSKKQGTGTNKQRAFQRVNLPGRVYIHDENRLFIAPLNNISAGGLFIDGLTTIQEGAEVKIVVKSPTLQRSIQACGRVVRVEKAGRVGLAVQFNTITKDTQVVIQESVDRAQYKAVQAKLAA